MPSLTIRDIPVELLEQLRARAKRERRSLNSEALIQLERALQHQQLSLALAKNRQLGYRALKDNANNVGPLDWNISELDESIDEMFEQPNSLIPPTEI